MSAPTVEPETAAPAGDDRGRADAAGVAPGRARLVVAVIGVLALALVLVLRAAAPVPFVAAHFDGDPRALPSAWGNLEFFGAEGSWIIVYQHDTPITMVVPWDGDEIVGAELLGVEMVPDVEEHLLTVSGVETRPDGVHVELLLDNCRFYNEREIDISRGIQLTDLDGDRTVLALDPPVLVHSPMLHGCPDRTLDRGDDRRGETDRR